jgi:outer membrane protein
MNSVRHMLKLKRTIFSSAAVVIVSLGFAPSRAIGAASAMPIVPLQEAPQSPASSSPPRAAGAGPSSAAQLPSGAEPSSATPNRGPIAPGSELTLRQAIQIGLTYHPRGQEAAADTNAAQARVGQAKSYLGPQAFGMAQYLRSTDNGIGNTSYYNADGMFPRVTGRNHDLPSSDFSQSSDTSNNFGMGVAFSQFLFDFGRRRGFVSEREFQARAAAAAERLTALEIIYEVSQRYFGLLQAKQLIRVYEKALEQRQYHLHEATVKAHAGLRPQLDIYVTQAEVERAQLHLVDAHNDYADAKVALDNALGLSDNAPAYEPADVLTYFPITAEYRSLLETAFNQRPDLRALDDQAKAMGARIVQFNSDYYPTVNAIGGYSALGTGAPLANNFNVGVLITWPIFNSFLTRDQVAEAKYRRDAIQHGIEDLRQKVIMQVHTAFLNWRASLQRIERAQKALDASRAELELAGRRYSTGLANIVELEDAQRHYTSDDATYADALYGYSLAKAAVDLATGRSLTSY